MRDQNPLPYHLGDTPRKTGCLQGQMRRLRKPTHCPRAPLLRQRRGNPFGCNTGPCSDKHAGPRFQSAAHPMVQAGRALRQPADTLRALPAGSRCAAVRRQRADFEGAGVSRVNCGAVNISPRGTMTCGHTTTNQRGGVSMGSSTSPPSRSKGGTPRARTPGTIGTQHESQPGQARQRPMQPPLLVQRQQHGSGVGTSTAHAATGRNALVHMDVRTKPGAALLLQQARGARGLSGPRSRAARASSGSSGGGFRRIRPSARVVMVSSSHRSTSWNTVSRS